MSRKQQLLPKITEFSTKIIRKFLRTTKKQLIWLVRTISGTQKRQKTANAGFVLPTVAMISIVVVLLTTAIMIRSFERAKNASNVRISQAAISSATPAIDRGRAKINQLFTDQSLPRATPTDESLYNALVNNIEKYTFGDETPLQITFDIDGDNTIDTPTSSTKIYDNEILKTAWKFPVDTDNNGKFDSYNIYGIYFRTPSVNTNGKYSRARNVLEARTPPMSEGTLDANCGANTSAVLVGNTGWIKQNNQLKKSFFVYTATVPITTTPTDTTNYEQYKGNKGFAAVEYQQDRVQIPPNNNAVVYEDDLVITPGVNLNLNGRIFTNSNFLTGGFGNVRLYQVSSKASCYYTPENSKIIVGGNLGSGNFTASSDSSNVATLDLYKGKTTNPSNTSWVKSVEEVPNDIIYNNRAYINRINKLVSAQFAEAATSDPSEVQKGIAKKKADLGLSSFTTDEFDSIRRKQLELYFKKRTRRVSYIEVGFNGTDTDPDPMLNGSGDTLRPDDKWIYPVDPSDGKTETNYSGLTLKTSSTSLNPKATEPKALKSGGGIEAEVGDRVLVGNNLPELWWDTSKEPDAFSGNSVTDTQNITGIKWDAGDTNATRTRRSLVETLADLGDTSRDGQWELDAATIPKDITDPVGGLRVVTGAGVYLNDLGTPASFNSSITTIWPDNYPVPQAPVQEPVNSSSFVSLSYDATTKTIKPYSLYNLDVAYKWRDIPSASTPFLQMRASAVYHYKSTSYNAQTPTPIACVSSFYVPTNSTTAKNQSTLPNASGILKDTNGLSNNGIVYPAPTKTETDYSTVLGYLKTLKYPNGRLIDDGLLARALAKTSNRTISEQSAIDAQICALQIRYDSSFEPVTTSPVIDHGAIRETSFLDPREIQKNSLSDDEIYNLPIIDRQPLEIRATVLDLDLLRKKTIGSSSPSQEYLLPNSGIIYATRDDALPDASAGTLGVQTDAQKLVSPIDYKLDTTRRPNGIMLVNGSKLYRSTTNTYREEEKGLILASNIPVYIQGQFNLHTQKEFTDAATTAFYDRATLNPQFACRPGDPRLSSCTTGDEWRPATVLADAVTLLSDNFRTGFRNEGDYDWNNSLVGTPATGFSQYNSFGSLGNWADTANAGYPKDFVPDVTGQAKTTGYQGSSYVNNFATPLIRWIPARQYAYEICSSSVESDCFCSSTDTTAQCAAKTKNWSLTNVAYNGFNGTNGQNNWRDAGINTSTNAIKTGFIGSNGPSNGWENLPFRRIAVKRNTTTTLPVSPLTFYGDPGTNGAKLTEYKADGSGTLPALVPTVLMPWLVPVSSNSTALKPVLQIEKPFAADTDPNNTTIISGETKTTSNPKESVDTRKWLQPVLANTTFNLIVVAGDSPARPTEDNGGLHNFVRFMENWLPAPSTGETSGERTAEIFGSFMQVRKSAYATGTYTVNVGASTITYPIKISSGSGTGYQPPLRNWGYDVALLSQSPDRFASKLVLTPPDLPDEYFREVSRDDKWVERLLCAKDTATTPAYAIDTDQRPSICRS